MPRAPRQEIVIERPRELRRCVTMDQHWRLVRLDPEYRWRRLQIERDIQDWIRRYGEEAGLRTGLVRIPVVVHVVHNTASQNISSAQIQTQLDVLNADFRRANADAVNTPAAFVGVAADARVEFALAVRDPNCNATGGITRTSTTTTGWTFPGDGMKAAATGGVDPWDVTKYLNLWVVNYIDGTLGYGTFPGMPANTQGVVIDYRAFGMSPIVAAPYDLGRTATHEVGHWLNLLHIWGDDGGACTGSDQVGDTPNQGNRHFGCPGSPFVSCSNGPAGDMFENYMDYSDDACMNLFTAGQAARMDAALFTQRAGILASDGLVPATGAPAADLWSQDVSDDFGAEPDPSGQPMYISDDIWVRKQNDGLTNMDTENPEYRIPGSASNYIYVRVRNRGCTGVQSGTVKLYWAKASSGLSWPAPWDGSVTAPAVMGGLVGSQPTSVAAGTTEILIFPWMPPNPADYASFGADQSHFCLLSRIETSSSPPYGMTSPETGDLYANVQKNNNIVWKNITVVDDLPGGGRVAEMLVTNFGKKDQRQAWLEFRAPREDLGSVFDWGQVYVELPKKLVKTVVELSPELVETVKRRRRHSAGIKRVGDADFEILENGAVLGPFELAPGDIHVVRARFAPTARHLVGPRVFFLDVQQRQGERVVGGVRFVLKIRRDVRAVATDHSELDFNGVTWVGGPDAAWCGCRC